MKILTIASEKGGSGKTTTAHSVAYGLYDQGYRILIIDADAQASLSLLCGVDVEKIEKSPLLEVLTDEKSIEDVITPIKLGLDIIPSSMALSVADMTLAGTMARETLLKNALVPVSGEYDFCIIDTAPAFNIITLCALVAADHVIVPTQLDLLSVQALLWLAKYTKSIKARINTDMDITGLLITSYDKRSTVHREVLPRVESIADSLFDSRVFDTKIRKSVATQKTQLALSDVYAADSTVSEDYTAFISELMKLI